MHNGNRGKEVSELLSCAAIVGCEVGGNEGEERD